MSLTAFSLDGGEKNFPEAVIIFGSRQTVIFDSVRVRLR